MLDEKDENTISEIVKKIVKEETQDLRSDVGELKQGQRKLEVLHEEMSQNVRKLGVMQEDMNDKIDLILEGFAAQNQKTSDYDELKNKVYDNHEPRIRALEVSSK